MGDVGGVWVFRTEGESLELNSWKLYTRVFGDTTSRVIISCDVVACSCDM
jgi:hypothetical protein